MNRARSSTTRSTVPAPITTSSSVSAARAMKLKTSRCPSTSVSSASTSISAPSGLARRCSRATEVPTEVSPAASCGSTAATVAASASASSRGVASTGTSPLPMAAAVSASVTAARTLARSPTGRTGRTGPPGLPSGRPRSLDDGNEVAFLDHVALGYRQLLYRSWPLGQDRALHLHRLQDDQRVAVRHGFTLGRHDLPHVRHHLRADLGHVYLLALSALAIHGPGPCHQTSLCR